MKVAKEADEFKKSLEIRRVDLRGMDLASLSKRSMVILHKNNNQLEALLLGEEPVGLGRDFYVLSTSGKTGKRNGHSAVTLNMETALARIRAHKDKCIFVAHENPTVVGELFKNFWDPLVIKQLVSEAVAETQPAALKGPNRQR